MIKLFKKKSLNHNFQDVTSLKELIVQLELLQKQLYSLSKVSERSTAKITLSMHGMFGYFKDFEFELNNPEHVKAIRDMSEDSMQRTVDVLKQRINAIVND